MGGPPWICFRGGPEAGARSSLEGIEFEKQFAIEEHHFWFVARRRLVTNALEQSLRTDARPARERRLLEVSCATGRNLVATRRYARSLGLDLAEEALGFCRRRGVDVVRADAHRIPLRDRSVDVVLALDALEHLDRDDVALIEIHRVLRPAGVLVVTVPAFPSLWSPHDEAFHHRRRYRRSLLRRRLAEAGLVVERITHWSSFLFPPLFLFRKLRSLIPSSGRTPPRSDFFTPVPWPIAGIVDAAYRLEARAVRHVDLPFGVSLLAIARRPIAEDPRPEPARGG